MDTKTKRMFIILISVSLILIIFNTYKDLPSVKIRKYLINRNFILESDNTFYYKQLSDKTKEEYQQDINNNISSNYDYLYFDKYNKKLIEEINEYTDKYESSLNINYNFSNSKINYFLRINYDNRKNIIFKGTYDEKTEQFKCNKEFNHNINIDNHKSYFCDYANGYIESFIYIKDKLFTEHIINKYLK